DDVGALGAGVAEARALAAGDEDDRHLPRPQRGFARFGRLLLLLPFFKRLWQRQHRWRTEARDVKLVRTGLGRGHVLVELAEQRQGEGGGLVAEGRLRLRGEAIPAVEQVLLSARTQASMQAAQIQGR